MILVSSGSVSVGKQRLRQSQVLNSSPLEMQMAGTSTVDSECACIHISCQAGMQHTQSMSHSSLHTLNSAVHNGRQALPILCAGCSALDA